MKQNVKISLSLLSVLIFILAGIASGPDPEDFDIDESSNETKYIGVNLGSFWTGSCSVNSNEPEKTILLKLFVDKYNGDGDLENLSDVQFTISNDTGDPNNHLFPNMLRVPESGSYLVRVRAQAYDPFTCCGNGIPVWEGMSAIINSEETNDTDIIPVTVSQSECW